MLNYRNDKLEQAKNQILEKDKKERKNQSALEGGSDVRANQQRKESIVSTANE